MTVNPIGIVSAYAFKHKLKVHEHHRCEYFTPQGVFQTFSISIGNDSINIQKNVDLPKKEVRCQAYKEFYETYKPIFEKPKTISVPKLSLKEQYESKPGLDYLQYSRDTVLQDVTVHVNLPEFFSMYHTMLSFDSEGGKPPCLAQFCSDPTTVYLFYLPQFMKEVCDILQDSNIAKIVCDKSAEEKSFGVSICNYVDIQGGNRKSLVTCIKEKFDVELKKDKRLHMNGWHQPFTKNQIDYAVADAIWTYKILE